MENKKNGEVKEKERKAPLKPSPQATPAKSTKDANNRKVIESKKALPKKEVTPKPAPAAEVKPKPERKPISRRPKAIKGPPSPIKKVRSISLAPILLQAVFSSDDQRSAEARLSFQARKVG